jgi:EAL domain-containing protein (putative c-di-GMP-specific phosphodiesterase class I)
VIAEGLELERDFGTLSAMGIELMQGFLFSHAQPATTVAREVRNVNCAAGVGEAVET